MSWPCVDLSEAMGGGIAGGASLRNQMPHSNAASERTFSISVFHPLLSPAGLQCFPYPDGNCFNI